MRLSALMPPASVEAPAPVAAPSQPASEAPASEAPAPAPAPAPPAVPMPSLVPADWNDVTDIGNLLNKLPSPEQERVASAIWAERTVTVKLLNKNLERDVPLGTDSTRTMPR